MIEFLHALVAFCGSTGAIETMLYIGMFIVSPLTGYMYSNYAGLVLYKGKAWFDLAFITWLAAGQFGLLLLLLGHVEPYTVFALTNLAAVTSPLVVKSVTSFMAWKFPKLWDKFKPKRGQWSEEDRDMFNQFMADETLPLFYRDVKSREDEIEQARKKIKE